MNPRYGSGDPVIDAVLQTAHRLRERSNAVLATCGLSLWTYKTLRALEDLGPSRSVDLSEQLGMAPRTVTGAIDNLETEGLVERRPHPTDRRAHLLVLTDQGRARLAEARVVHGALVAEAASALSADERAQFLPMIDAIRGALSAPVELAH